MSHIFQFAIVLIKQRVSPTKIWDYLQFLCFSPFQMVTRLISIESQPKKIVIVVVLGVVVVVIHVVVVVIHVVDPRNIPLKFG